ncbi:MAG: SMC-Scp complex subunit ScpB [Chloroflexota bacterium]
MEYHVDEPPVDSAPHDLARHLVAVLFAGGGPVKMEEVARALGAPVAQLDGLLLQLREHPPLGLRVQRQGGELELVTDPGSARYVETLLGLDRPVKLSRAALETLAIVVYRQPVTRGEVEAIRGVNSDSAVTTLMNRGLIAEVGRKESVGRPALYGATSEFLQYLGLDSLEDLPPLPE